MARTRLDAVFSAAVAIALAIGVGGLAGVAVQLRFRPAHPLLDPARGPRWPEHAATLTRQVGRLKYLGGAHVQYGGLDVYEAEPDRWWIVGPEKRFTPCRPEELQAVADELIREEGERRGPPTSL